MSYCPSCKIFFLTRLPPGEWPHYLPTCKSKTWTLSHFSPHTVSQTYLLPSILTAPPLAQATVVSYQTNLSAPTLISCLRCLMCLIRSSHWGQSGVSKTSSLALNPVYGCLKNVHTLKFMFYLYSSVSFDKCMEICKYHHSQNSGQLTSPSKKSPHAAAPLLSNPPPIPHPWQPLICSWSLDLPFPGSHRWNGIVRNLRLWFLSLVIMHMNFIWDIC